MHKECGLNHESELVEAESDEFEWMLEVDPSSDKPPSPLAVVSSAPLGDNLTFQLNA